MREFDDFLSRKLDHYLANAPENLGNAIRYSLLSAGKRIRSSLCIACSDMVGLPRGAGQTAAAAIEMIHCFTLIHDDLPCMDNDDFRRGLPSNHKVHGEALALLAGDGLIPLALDIFLELAALVPAIHFISGLRRFNESIGPRGVIGGQAQEFLLHERSTLNDLREMFRKKTGALFSAALLVPKDLAGISDSSKEGVAISDLADLFGIAFQVHDDLEDQHQDEKGSGVRPTQILYHQSAKDASQAASSQLSESMKHLTKIWGMRAQPVVEIAAQLLCRLERIGHS